MDGPGKSPVHDIDLAALAEHDVFRLEIAVHDVAAVGVFDGVADAQEKFQTGKEGLSGIELGDSFFRVLLVHQLQVILECMPLDVLHAQKEIVVIV